MFRALMLAGQDLASLSSPQGGGGKDIPGLKGDREYSVLVLVVGSAPCVEQSEMSRC